MGEARTTTLWIHPVGAVHGHREVELGRGHASADRGRGSGPAASSPVSAPSANRALDPRHRSMHCSIRRSSLASAPVCPRSEVAQSGSAEGIVPEDGESPDTLFEAEELLDRATTR